MLSSLATISLFLAAAPEPPAASLRVAVLEADAASGTVASADDRAAVSGRAREVLGQAKGVHALSSAWTSRLLRHLGLDPSQCHGEVACQLEILGKLGAEVGLVGTVTNEHGQWTVEWTSYDVARRAPISKQAERAGSVAELEATSAIAAVRAMGPRLSPDDVPQLIALAKQGPAPAKPPEPVVAAKAPAEAKPPEPVIAAKEPPPAKPPQPVVSAKQPAPAASTKQAPTPAQTGEASDAELAAAAAMMGPSAPSTPVKTAPATPQPTARTPSPPTVATTPPPTANTTPAPATKTPAPVPTPAPTPAATPAPSATPAPTRPIEPTPPVKAPPPAATAALPPATSATPPPPAAAATAPTPPTKTAPPPSPVPPAPAPRATTMAASTPPAPAPAPLTPPQPFSRIGALWYAIAITGAQGLPPPEDEPVEATTPPVAVEPTPVEPPPSDRPEFSPPPLIDTPPPMPELPDAGPPALAQAPPDAGPPEPSGLLQLNAVDSEGKSVVGAPVLVDGKKLGDTPFSGAVPVGHHQLRVTSGDTRASEEITIRTGDVVQRSVELTPAVVNLGGLYVDAFGSPTVGLAPQGSGKDLPFLIGFGASAGYRGSTLLVGASVREVAGGDSATGIRRATLAGVSTALFLGGWAAIRFDAEVGTLQIDHTVWPVTGVRAGVGFEHVFLEHLIVGLEADAGLYSFTDVASKSDFKPGPAFGATLRLGYVYSFRGDRDAPTHRGLFIALAGALLTAAGALLAVHPWWDGHADMQGLTTYHPGLTGTDARTANLVTEGGLAACGIGATMLITGAVLQLTSPSAPVAP